MCFYTKESAKKVLLRSMKAGFHTCAHLSIVHITYL